jgi:DNA-binding MarR family transcriptional regulator
MSSARMKQYVPLVQDFAGRVVMFHSAVAETLGLHATDLRALRLLGVEPMTAGALGEGLGLTGAATTALIDRLESAGYVLRERDGVDRRKVTIRAIPEKLSEVDHVYRRMGEKMSKLLSAYNPAEFAAIADFIKRTTQILVDETRRMTLQAHVK